MMIDVQVTDDQVERAKLLGLDDTRPGLQDQIREVIDVTKKSYEDASIALHDNDFNTQLAVQQLLDSESMVRMCCVKFFPFFFFFGRCYPEVGHACNQGV